MRGGQKQRENVMSEHVTDTGADADAGMAPPTGDAVMVERGVMCIICEYELGGLAADGVCPECSTAIERSLRGDWLRYEEPQWLARVARGLRLMRWGVLCAALGFVSVIAMALVIGLLVGSGGSQGSTLLVGVVAVAMGALMMGLMLTSAVLYGLGCWWVTALNRAGASVLKRERLAARWTMPLFASSALLMSGGSLARGAMANWPVWVATVMLGALVLVWAGHRVAISLALRRLHQRTGSWDRKARRAHARPWGAAGIVVVLCALAIGLPLIVGIRAGRGEGLALFVLFVGMIAMDGRLRAAARGVKGEIAAQGQADASVGRH